MSKFYGTVGFVKTVETKPGIWEEQVEEKGYYGDLIRNIGRYNGSNKVNADFTLNNQISIVTDPYALENLQFIKFVRFLGTAWVVSSIDVEYPRLVLSLGDIYNEEEKDED